jgi:hypothetical protein
MTQFCIFIVLFLQSCVTLQKMSSADSTYIHKTISSDCRNLDGSHNLYFKIQNSTMSLDLDWITHGDGTFEGDFFDPLGRSVAHWKMNGNYLSFVSDFSSALSSLQVDETGFLTLDGQSLLIKSEELGCFFSGRLPKSWTNGLLGDLTTWRLEYTDEWREIEFEGGKTRCGSVQSRGFKSLFTSSIKFCISSSNKSGNIYWRDQFRVEWSSLDEPGS